MIFSDFLTKGTWEMTHEVEYKLVPTEYKLSHLMPQTML